MRLAIVLALVASCADLPPIVARCGNGVLEPGEDCDTPDDPRCQACGWTCTSTADCASIPPPKRSQDYACGVDGFCHAPGGELAPETAAPQLDADQFYTTDINGDGFGDVVGVAATTLETRFGDPAAQLAGSAIEITAGAAGAAAISDIDGDGRLDTLVPTRDGIAAYASPYRALLPYAFPIEVAGAAVAPVALAPLDGTHVVALYAGSASTIVGAVADLSTTPPTLAALSPCDAFPATPGNASSIAATLTAYAATGSAGANTVLAFVAATASGAAELCTESIAAAGSAVARALGGAPSSAVLAELDESGCPSLFALQGSAAVRFVGTVQAGQCTFDGTTAAMPAVGVPGDALIGHAVLSPRIAGLAPDAIVTTSGVYGIQETGGAADPALPPVQLYAADRALTAAASGDLDGNGAVDTVALGDDSTLDLLYRTVSPDGFVRGRLATAAPPSRLVVADFDGNGLADVAYVATVAGAAALQIVYDTAAGPLPAVEAGAFAAVTASVRVALPSSADPNGVVSGLAVVPPGGAAAVSVASVFHGSVDRTLAAFVDPRGPSPQSTYRGVVGGHFVDGGTGVDVVAFEVPDGGGVARLWQLAGAPGGGVFYPSPGAAEVPETGAVPLVSGSSPVADCALTGSGSGACGATTLPFCVDRSRLVDWPEARDDNPDDVIGIDAQHGCAFDLTPTAYDFTLASGSGSDFATAAAETITCMGSGACFPTDGTATLTEAFPADIDGDHFNRLVLAFATGAGTGGVLACDVPDAANGLTCQDPAAGLPFDGTCSDAVIGRFSLPSDAPDSGVELAMLCGDTVYRVDTVPGVAALPFAFTATPLVQLALPAGSSVVQIAAHDVNGDGLDDLLVLATGPDGVRRLHVFPQLTSREVAP
jgi:hypothetical protein